MINIQNYTLIRSDRLDKKGGGVALYFKSSLNVTILEKPLFPIEFNNFNYLAIEIFTRKTLVRILCIYIAPFSTNCSSTMKVISNTITHFSVPNQPLFLLGDFNHPKIDWTNLISSVSKDKILLDLQNDLSLTLLINEPTQQIW